MTLKDLLLGRKAITTLDSILKSSDNYLAYKGPSSQSYGFSSSHVWMWELDHKESWAPKNWCFWTVLLEQTLESPLDSKEIQPVNPKGKQSWIFIGRTDVEAEAPILWPSDVKNWFMGKDPDAGKIEVRRRRGRQRMRWLDGITDLMDMSLGKSRSWWWTGKSRVLQSMRSQRVGHEWVTEMNWTEAVHIIHRIFNGTKNKRLCWASMKNSQNCHRIGLSNE